MYSRITEGENSTRMVRMSMAACFIFTSSDIKVISSIGKIPREVSVYKIENNFSKKKKKIVIKYLL